MLKQVFLSAAILAGATISSQAAVLFSDDFNGATQGLDVAPAGWNVSNGTVDVIGSGFYDFYPGSGNYLDMDGSTFNAGRIDTISTFNLIAGNTYTISFDYGVNGSAAETLNFGIGSILQTLVIPAGGVANLTTLAYTFVAAANESGVSLFFEALGGDQQGPVLDNVSLQVSAVPLPAAAPLLVTALFGLGALARRRRMRT
jgi:hypothetical protein